MKLKVIVHPGSKRPRVETDLLGDWHIYVREPPLEGQANAAVIVALAAHFGVPKSRVTLRRGSRSKIKYFEIDR